jgi:hypothetical protein
MFALPAQRLFNQQRKSPTRHAVTPADTWTAGGALRLRTSRHQVLADTLISGLGFLGVATIC